MRRKTKGPDRIRVFQQVSCVVAGHPSFSSGPLTYREAGVNIDAGNALVERIRPLAQRSARREVIGGLGGFGALFDLTGKYQNPVLVSGTDGVGTKLKLAQDCQRHSSIGIDLVAMCVNDILVQGAEPLFFLDYFATGTLDIETASAVIGSIAAGCQEAGCALIGGETAEMPDMYPPGSYDLAGFAVGAVEKSQLIDGRAVVQGDVLIGIASSGPHSNGYSLIRRIYARARPPAEETLSTGMLLRDALLQPTMLYVKPVLGLLSVHGQAIHAMAHITGGGLQDNIIRVIPPSLAIEIDAHSWPQPDVFQWLQREGQVDPREMWRTFNCGIGFVLVVAAGDVAAVSADLQSRALDHWTIGRVIGAETGQERVTIG